MRSGAAVANETDFLKADIYEPVKDELARARDLFDQELASEFPFINTLCEEVRSYRGKMLRPALLLLSAKATGRVTAAHPTLAAVVEMVHVATLVHDDVLDEADERRKRPTIRTLQGNVGAVLLGDYLISHAFHLCSALDDTYACRRIGDATNTVCKGELLQNALRGDTDVSEADYLDLARRKTAALTSVACELGAHYAGAEPALVEAMSRYGDAVGVAFQIIDDVLDITGEASELGKTLGLDLAGGKLTLPTIHCLTHADSSTTAALRAAIRDPNGSEPRHLSRWLAETDSVAYAVSVAARFISQADNQLEKVPPSLARRTLRVLAEFILKRHC